MKGSYYMEWKWSTCDAIWAVLILVALALSFHILTCWEMKKTTKYIYAAIVIVIILLFPFGRKWEVNKLIRDNDYKLIVQTGWVSYSFSEVSPEKYLNKPCLLGLFYINSENKLVYYSYGTFYFDHRPRSMEQIQLK